MVNVFSFFGGGGGGGGDIMIDLKDNKNIKKANLWNRNASDIPKLNHFTLNCNENDNIFHLFVADDD